MILNNLKIGPILIFLVLQRLELRIFPPLVADIDGKKGNDVPKSVEIIGTEVSRVYLMKITLTLPF